MTEKLSMKILIYFFSLWIFFSCGQDALKERDRKLGSNLNQDSKITRDCSCGFDNNPVCGNDGKTYNNPCLATCLSSGGYSQGACSCNSNSGYLCGQPPMPICPDGQVCAQVMPALKSYADECELVRANARYLYLGICN